MCFSWGDGPIPFLMTDDAPAFYNAFRVHFGGTVHLLCKWHVLRAWARKSLELIGGKANTLFREQLMSNLRDLIK
jgi:hypothetical protein